MTQAVRDAAAELDAAKAEIDRLRTLCAEVYQVAGALGADDRVLDNLWAAADGKPLPHASLLPYPDKSPVDEIASLAQALQDCHRPEVVEHLIAFMRLMLKKA